MEPGGRSNLAARRIRKASRDRAVLGVVIDFDNPMRIRLPLEGFDEQLVFKNQA